MLGRSLQQQEIPAFICYSTASALHRQEMRQQAHSLILFYQHVVPDPPEVICTIEPSAFLATDSRLFLTSRRSQPISFLHGGPILLYYPCLRDITYIYTHANILVCFVCRHTGRESSWRRSRTSSWRSCPTPSSPPSSSRQASHVLLTDGNAAVRFSGVCETRVVA